MKKLLMSLVMVFMFVAFAFASLNVNTAGVEALDELPGIGIAKAKAIVAYRAKHGDFKTIEELQNVKGIGEKLVEKLRGHVTCEE